MPDFLTLSPICREEALRYMGFHGDAPDAVLSQRIDRCERLLRDAAKPRYVYSVVPLAERNGTLFAGALPLPGTDTAAHLQGCQQAILMAATLSVSADQLIQRAEKQDMTDALILDALSSAAIEQVCDQAEKQMHAVLPEWYFTWRFSPGYGDLPLSLQPMLLQILNASRQIGLTVTENNILMPRKSVTAILGLSRTPLPRQQRGCVVCKLHETCPYRKKGVHCQ